MISGGEGQTRDLALSSDGLMVALSSNDGLIHVIDLATGAILDILTVGSEDATNVEFIHDDRHLLVTSLDGPVEILTLDASELIAISALRITRSFDPEECATFHLDPCPTLEEIRSR